MSKSDSARLAAAAPSRARSAASDTRRATSRGKLLDRSRQQAGLLVHDDVSGAAGVHRGDRDRQCAGFDEHPAQWFGPGGRKNQQRRVTQPPEHLAPLQPAEHPHVAPASAAAVSIGARSGPSPTTTSGISRRACLTARPEHSRPYSSPACPRTMHRAESRRAPKSLRESLRR